MEQEYSEIKYLNGVSQKPLCCVSGNIGIIQNIDSVSGSTPVNPISSSINASAVHAVFPVACIIDPDMAAATILRKFAARAISMLSSPRELEDGRTLPPRMSANDCYVVLEDSCRKMARVAVRKYEADAQLQLLGFDTALKTIFPDPPAYLSRCIRSVVSDTDRMARRDVSTISIDQPFGSFNGDSGLCLRDTIADKDVTGQPEQQLIDREERREFRMTLAAAMNSIPKNYLEAIQRDMARERERQSGAKVTPETDKERQTVCRARAALAAILKKECGTDNPYIRLLSQQRNTRVRQKPSASPNWTKERQSDLFRRLLKSSWQERAAQTLHASENIEEAIVNQVSEITSITPPSPEMRQSMRVLDLYVLDNNPTTENSEAQKLYESAWKSRKSGNIEEAIRLYRLAYEKEPKFLAAYTEVGLLLMQSGNLREALKVYLEVIEHPHSGEQKYIAATNAADVYLTWFDAGRNKERNIEQALYFARIAMEKPSPMRACNLLLAYVKERYYMEAQKLMDSLLQANLPDCPSEKFLQTLFQIRDADLVSWWNWLDGELVKEDR